MIEKLIQRIAVAVERRLTDRFIRDEFLPPVECKGVVYLCTKNGAVYSMTKDYEGMETICQIRRP